MQIPYKVSLKEKIHRFFRLLLPVIVLCTCNSCSSSGGIDDYFTFNLDKSQAVAIPPSIIIGQDFTDSFALGVDSTDFAKNSTSQSLIKSIECTKITHYIPPDKDIHFSQLIVSADSLPDLVLATYAGIPDYTFTKDSVVYSHAGFLAYFLNPSSHFTITFHADQTPKNSEQVSFSYTLVLTGKPKN